MKSRSPKGGDARIAEIRAAGARGDEVEELLAYNENAFDLSTLGSNLDFPLPDEPFVATWREWAQEAQREGAFAVLRRHLPQLRFPISEGTSQSSAYRAATLQGLDPAGFEEATGLDIGDPEALRMEIYPSLAGHIPILSLSGRSSFVALTRALSKRNEPVEISDSMGAQMIGGYNNWERIHRLKETWLSQEPEERQRPTWGEEFAHIRQHKELFQDRFILLSEGPYSAVPAHEMVLENEVVLEDEIWRRLSWVIRREHECTHYFTRRLFGSMRNNLLDELIADYAGIVAALGRYRADWFLRFLGFDDAGGEEPRYRSEGGRMAIYRGEPPLSEGALHALQILIVRAARNLQTFDHEELRGERSRHVQALVLAALATQRLDELASDEGPAFLRDALVEARSSLRLVG